MASNFNPAYLGTQYPAFMQASSEGLDFFTLRTAGFDPARLSGDRFYPLSLFFTAEVLSRWVELRAENPTWTGDQVFAALEAEGVISDDDKVSLTADDLKTLNRFSKAQGSQVPNGVMADAYIESPIYIKVLSEMMNPDNGDYFWYFPLVDTKYWYRGIDSATVDFTDSENLTFNNLISKASSSNLTLHSLLDAREQPIPFASFGLWPRPVSSKILKSWQGFRPSTNQTENLITGIKIGLSDTDQTDVVFDTVYDANPVGAPDTFTAEIEVVNSTYSKPRIYLKSLTSHELVPGQTYTLSFYAKLVSSSTDTFRREVSDINRGVLFHAGPQTLVSPLYDTWKRHYVSFTYQTNLSLYLELSSSVNVRMAGFLLEESEWPSAYDVRFCNWRESDPESREKLIYPLLFQLPISSVTVPDPKNQPISKPVGTFIYRKYIEDFQFTGKHFDSLGFTDAKYLSWGFDGQSAVLQTLGDTVEQTPTVLASLDVSGKLSEIRDTWLTCILGFDFTVGSNNIRWTVYGSDPLNPIIDLTGSVSWESGLLNTCAVSSLVRYKDPTSETFARFNLALGSQLSQGVESAEASTDPYDRLFSEAETHIGDPDGSIYQAFTYVSRLLTAEERQRLMLQQFYLKWHQASLAEDGITDAGLALIGNGLRQSGYSSTVIQEKALS